MWKLQYFEHACLNKHTINFTCFLLLLWLLDLLKLHIWFTLYFTENSILYISLKLKLNDMNSIKSLF